MASVQMLEVSNLNVSYGDSWVLFDLNLTFPPNSVSIIVGRNGAGKSTLFKAISGFLKPSSGKITLKGQDINGVRPYKIVRMGLKYIPQDKGVFSDLTVKENLELAGYATKDNNWEPVFYYFPKLKELLNRKSAFLSGGERQMLMIGRAILGHTDIMLIDEPMEGLAPTIVQDLVATFKQLKQNMSLVIVEQNLAVARELADQLYLMKEGRVIAQITNKSEIESLSFESEL